VSLSDPYSHLKNPKVVHVSLPLQNDVTMQLEGVAHVIAPPLLRLIFLPDQLPVEKIDVNEKCVLNIDTGQSNITLITTIDEIENDHTLKLTNIESTTHEQKRKFFRVDAQISVDLQHIPSQQASPMVGESINISGNGVLVFLPEEFEVDQRVGLKIDLPEFETLGIQCIGRVIRCDKKNQGGYKVAFCYDSIDEEDQDKIVAFCLSQQRKQLRLRVQVLGPA